MILKPKYTMFLLESREDLDKKFISILSILWIKIEEAFIVNDKAFQLKAIIYFQNMHYTCHVNGIYHKSLSQEQMHGFIMTENKLISKISLGVWLRRIPYYNLSQLI